MPKRVSVIRVPEPRANKSSPNSPSSSRIATEIDGWDTLSSFAAAVVLPVCAAAAK